MKKHTKTHNSAKEVPRVKFVSVNVCIERKKKSQIQNLTFHFKPREKRGQDKPKASKRKEVIKIRV